MATQKTDFDFQEFAQRWKAPAVARTDEALAAFSGGTLPKARTMANLDSLGKGPKGRFRVGRCVAYPVSSLLRWMAERGGVNS
jgi:hypothetical protein